MLNVYLPNEYGMVIFQTKEGHEILKEMNYQSNNCRIALPQPRETARTWSHHRLTLYRWQPKIPMPVCMLQASKTFSEAGQPTSQSA